MSKKDKKNGILKEGSKGSVGSINNASQMAYFNNWPNNVTPIKIRKPESKKQ
jgi:hypothetical protein